jgi:hypothetical protein
MVFLAHFTCTSLDTVLGWPISEIAIWYIEAVSVHNSLHTDGSKE